MAKTNYTVLIDQLRTISNLPSDNGNRQGYDLARRFIAGSNLSSNHKKIVQAELHSGADTNHGYYYNSNGVHEAVMALKRLSAENCTPVALIASGGSL